MNAEPSPTRPDAGPPASTPADPASPDRPGASRPGPARGLPPWLMTLGVGLVAALISWAGGEVAFDRFRMEDYMVKPPGYDQLSGYEKQARTSEMKGDAQHRADQWKAATSFGLLGLVLGAGLGLAGGWSAGSSGAAGRGTLGGSLAGAAAGAGLSWIVVPLYYRFEDPEMGMMVLLATHAALFIGIGGAAGLGLGLGLGDRPAMARAVLGGLFGGFVGTFALAVVYAMVFPQMRTFEPIASERVPRLAMYLCVGIGIGLLSGLIAGRPAHSRGVGPGRGAEDTRGAALG